MLDGGTPYSSVVPRSGSNQPVYSCQIARMFHGLAVLFRERELWRRLDLLH